MVFDSLVNGLRGSIQKILRSTGGEKIDEALMDIRTSLLQSDVDVKIVDEFISKVKEDLKANKGKGMVTREKAIDVIYNNLVKLVGSGEEKISITSVPYKILLVGLFGSGKTTTAAKLANYFKKRGYSVLLLGLDTSRPAAYEQLLQLGKSINTKVLGGEKSSLDSIRKYENEFKNFDIIIADSAGRDALDEQLINEIKSVHSIFKPNDTILVIPADLGQNAALQVSAFHKALGINHIILTKTDGTANGGGALTASYISGAKVVFIGTGEKINAFEEFDPKRFVSQLLGLDNLQELLEKAQEENIKVNEESVKKIVKGEFSLLDMYDQYANAKKMGPLDKVASMIPGLPSSGRTKELMEKQGENIGKFINVMDSMTKEELENPKIIDSKRISRIARGSGQDEAIVRELLSQYNKTKQVMKMSKNRQVSDLLRRFGINLGG
ncbi:MAG: signal recognition particle receptor subunit alpha [Nanoarchaeota archaeon]|nr:signal recognition particle receptor subunit alpha [Nanoarchaeota archaeon]